MPHCAARGWANVFRRLGSILPFLAVLVCSGCYHVRVIVPQPDPGTEYKKQNVQSLVWGTRQLPSKDLAASDCLNSTALDEVRVSSNLGYSFLTVGTLGFWSPSQVEWRCSKPQQQPSETIHKKKSVSLGLDTPPQTNADQLTGRQTIHTLAWGLVAKNAVSNCADSRSMDEVHVGSNLGFHFLTVATLGFWSPTTVQWKCSRPHQQSLMFTPDSPSEISARLDSHER